MWLGIDALLCAPYGANWAKRIARCAPEVNNDPEMWERIPDAERQIVKDNISARQAEASAAQDVGKSD